MLFPAGFRNRHAGCCFPRFRSGNPDSELPFIRFRNHPGPSPFGLRLLQRFLTGIYPIHQDCRTLSNPSASYRLPGRLCQPIGRNRRIAHLDVPCLCGFLRIRPHRIALAETAFIRSPVRSFLCADNLKPRKPMSDCGIPCLSAGPVVHPEYAVYDRATLAARFICILADASNPYSSRCKTVSGVSAGSRSPVLRRSSFIIRYPADAKELPPFFCGHILCACNLRKNFRLPKQPSDLFRAAQRLLAFASGRSGS